MLCGGSYPQINWHLWLAPRWADGMGVLNTNWNLNLPSAVEYAVVYCTQVTSGSYVTYLARWNLKSEGKSSTSASHHWFMSFDPWNLRPSQQGRSSWSIRLRTLVDLWSYSMFHWRIANAHCIVLKFCHLKWAVHICRSMVCRPRLAVDIFCSTEV